MGEAKRDSGFLCFLHVALVLLSLSPVFAGNRFFKNFNLEYGLPQNYIYSIAQDPRGYLLVCTGEGIGRYNGRAFEVFNTKDSIAGSFVTHSHMDSKGDLWLGHYEGGITRYRNGQFETIDLGEHRSSRINDIAESAEGHLLFLTQNSGILVYDKSNGHLQQLKLLLRDVLLYAIEPVGDHHYLLGTNEGVYVLESLDPTNMTVLFRLDHVPPVQIKSLLSMDNGTFWIGSEEFGIFRIRESDLFKDQQHTPVTSLKMEDGLSSNNVQYMMRDVQGHVWVGTKDAGAVRIRMQAEEAIGYDQYNRHNGLQADYITHIFQDGEGTIWMGSYGQGLFQLQDRVFDFYHSEDIAGSDNVTALALSSDGQQLWAGTDNGLFQARIDGNGMYDGTPEPVLNGKAVSTLFMDSTNRLWIGTAENGLYIHEPSGKVRQVNHELEVFAKYINHIMADQAGSIWVSTTTNGVYILKADGQKQQLTTNNGLPHNDVYMSFADREGRIWLATHGGALAMYKDERFNHQDDGDGVFAHNFNGFAEDLKGHIWVATYGSGVLQYKDFHYKTITPDNGLLSKYIYALLCDDKNYIWVGTRKGFSKIDQEQNRIYNYDVKSELGLHEVNLNAAIKDEKGDLWFGTNHGIVRHSYSNYQFNATTPMCVINLVTWNEDTVPLDSGAVPEFSYNEHQLYFSFDGLSLKQPENVLYRYKLEGHSQEWSEPSNLPRASFANLREGNYRFVVQAANNDGVWGITSTFEFRIVPPFWRTWWFLSLAFVLVMLTVALTTRWRERQLREKNRELEEKVMERTSEVVRQKDEIEQKNKDIKDSIRYASRIQRAIMPQTPALAEGLVKDIGLVFRPKDIVSGDFYWLGHSDHTLVIAAVDCTGHGVPGALMSILGNNGLEHAVKVMGQNDPGKILDTLNERVIKTLQQKDQQVQVQDGMDAAICCISENEFTYAGAKNPLYLIRGGELLEIKANKQPIGFLSDHVERYDTHHFERKSGDRLYIFSDGYADQFGGPDGKKFRYKQFRETLVATAQLPIDDQCEELKRIFNEWKGEEEQLDDVLVIAIEL